LTYGYGAKIGPTALVKTEKIGWFLEKNNFLNLREKTETVGFFLHRLFFGLSIGFYSKFKF
jgi:hypothetical protein